MSADPHASHEGHAGHAPVGGHSHDHRAEADHAQSMENRGQGAASNVPPGASDVHRATPRKASGQASHQHHAGHDKHAGHSPEAFRRRFWLSLALTAGTLAFDAHFLALLRLQPPDIPFTPWVPPLLGSALFVYGGWPFLQGAVRELRDRTPGMMTLVALAITVAFVYSLAVAAGVTAGMALWWELATLITVMVLGHWIEMASVQSAGRALEHLASLVPSIAHRMARESQEVEDISVADLRAGDRILVRPGEQVPADGAVTDGASSMNEAFLTGESRPVPKAAGGEVIAGAVNGEGALVVEVTRTGDETTLSQIRRLVADAQASRGRFQNVADRAAGWLTYIAVAAGAATFVVWLALGSTLDFAVIRSVTVLVMACPHALGLAIPLVVVNATAMSARNGILVRNREAFERARDVRIVAFDKTGTLTEGRHVVRSVHTEAMSGVEAVRLASALEARSEHPLAAAVLEEARRRGVAVPAVEDFEVAAGLGVAGRVDGRAYRIGRPEWADGLAFPDDLRRLLEEAEARGESVIALMNDGTVVALFTFADRVRDSARQAVAALKAAGVEPVMITGDAEAVARTVAAEVGIERVHARVLPQDKSALVASLRKEGPTAFVGDGINDAPALLEADVGIAIGAGTNVAIESADLVLIEDDPMDVVRALRLSRATYRKMIQNLFWATGYNAIALPLAAGVAYGAGIVLSPAAGAVFMSASTVVVALNAMLLRRARL